MDPFDLINTFEGLLNLRGVNYFAIINRLQKISDNDNSEWTKLKSIMKLAI